MLDDLQNASEVKNKPEFQAQKIQGKVSNISKW